LKLSSLEAIATALEGANVRYLIAGGLAVAAHGHGRATFDVDLIVQLQPDNARRAMTALESLGYRPSAPVPAHQFADAQTREVWIREKGMVVFALQSDLHPETSVDLFVTEPFDFDAEYEQALIGELLPNLRLRFVSLKTLIRMKEAVGREKDKEDIRQLNLLQREVGDEP